MENLAQYIQAMDLVERRARKSVLELRGIIDDYAHRVELFRSALDAITEVAIFDLNVGLEFDELLDIKREKLRRFRCLCLNEMERDA